MGAMIPQWVICLITEHSATHIECSAVYKHCLSIKGPPQQQPNPENFKANNWHWVDWHDHHIWSSSWQLATPACNYLVWMPKPIFVITITFIVLAYRQFCHLVLTQQPLTPLTSQDIKDFMAPDKGEGTHSTGILVSKMIRLQNDAFICSRCLVVCLLFSCHA